MVCRLAVLTVAFEPLRIDLGPHAWNVADANRSVGDGQRFCQQVIGHIQEVGKFTGPAGGRFVCRPEGVLARRLFGTYGLQGGTTAHACFRCGVSEGRNFYFRHM